jgi:hypothetical protein
MIFSAMVGVFQGANKAKKGEKLRWERPFSDYVPQSRGRGFRGRR